MRRMPSIPSVLLCGSLLAACANSTPPTVSRLEPTLPARPHALLAVPQRPLPPADDPPSQEAVGAYAVELLGHVLGLEAQLQALSGWFDTAWQGGRPD
ncbi:hypothetical protein [Stella sp.]|uniref:hypothetical protein n=1 Tax=Stella sp. TaxID=2912054 RepID=UPI0035AFF1FC